MLDSPIVQVVGGWLLLVTRFVLRELVSGTLSEAGKESWLGASAPSPVTLRTRSTTHRQTRTSPAVESRNAGNVKAPAASSHGVALRTPCA